MASSSRRRSSSRRPSDAKAFLRKAASILELGDLSGEIVMDIGCGSGTSCISLLTEFPEIEAIIAFDILPLRIEEAKSTNGLWTIDYHVADIEDSSTLENWIGDMSIVVSIYCFNYLKNPGLGFQNLHHLLRYGGKAAILMILNSRFYDFLSDFSQNERWKPYLIDVRIIIPESHAQKRTSSYYQGILDEISFETLQCAEELQVYAYETDEECRNALFGMCPIAVPLPKDERQEFMSAAFEVYMEHNPRDDNGKPCMYNQLLSVLVKKADFY